MSRVITRKEFESWLREHAEGETVGTRNNCWACPIANAMVAKYGGKWWVDDSGIGSFGAGHEGRRFDTPEWGRKFMAVIDGGDSDVPVSATEALFVLGAQGHEHEKQ